MDHPTAETSIGPLIAAVAIMLTLQITISMSVLSGPVLIELAAPELGVAVHSIGYFLSIIFVFATFSSLMCGSFIGRFGPVRVIQGCLILTAGALGLASSGDPWAVAIAGPVVGLAMGPTTPAATQLLGKLSPPRHRGLIFSLNQSGVPIGNALAGAILPSLGLLLGWQAPLLVMAGLCLALVVAAQTQRRRLDLDLGNTGALFSLRAIAEPMRVILRTPPLLRASLTSGGYAGMQACVSAFLVAIMIQRAGFDLVAAGVVLTVAQIAGALGRVLWGFITDRTGRPALMLSVVGVLMTIFAILIGAVEQDWPLALILLCAAILGGTGIGWNGVYLAEVARLSPPGRVGSIIGATSMYTFSGVLVVPSLFSLIVGQTDSYQMGFLFAALLSAAGALLCLPQAFKRVE
jgi:MFS family permease